MKLPFDLESVMDDLKDFQRRSVNYVFRRMYRDENQTHRFLVADEAGLGKTMVARGVIAHTVKHLWEKNGRIDVVYICSNADIARQNINRLNIADEEDFVLSSRITLLPTKLKSLSKNKLNFVSFTPGTSFNLRSTLGRQSERVLLYWMLDRAWGIAEWGTGPQNVLRGYASADNFRNGLKNFDPTSIDETLRDDFIRALKKDVSTAKKAGRENYYDLLMELSDRFQWKRQNQRIPSEDKQDRARLVGGLRAMLAQTCLKALEPDLVILDEFQRFKHLLGGEDEASQLARDLFTYTDDHTEVRVLLLSATPYKMYTMSHEEGEDHYRDFVETLRFLQRDPEKTARFQELLDEYRRELLRMGSFGVEKIFSLQTAIEGQLREYMVRMERLADSVDRNGMLVEASNQIFGMGAEDVGVYLQLEKLTQLIGHRNPVEYWKSSPYLLNFMDNYQLKVGFEDAVQTPGLDTRLQDIFKDDSNLFLPWERIRNYQPIDLGNARLRDLVENTMGKGDWKRMWIPPAFSYYRLDPPFAVDEQVTKWLIFSSWVVVPKAVSTLTSYEAERRIFTGRDSGQDYEEYSDRSRLLTTTISDQRLTGMPVLGIIYPSFSLAELCDPYRLTGELEDPASGDVLTLAEERIQRALARLPDRIEDNSSPPDEAWYWAAPILLDQVREETQNQLWWDQESLASIWAGEEEDDSTRWAEHVDYAREILEIGELGRRPEDLAQVLARIGVGGPGVCALRALSRVVGGEKTLPELDVRNAAAQIAWGMRSYFNKHEAIAVIRQIYPGEPYWQLLLDYAVGGGLQAVLDEYAHILREALGLFDHHRTEVVQEIAEAMREALTLRTVTLGVDDIRREGGGYSIEKRRMRASICVKFGDESGEFSDDPTRADQVRAAFNSPFWPFILVTTSVGQEGLDFHQYCHKIVHWNLPSNPVDLEQREGRVHRYKCHAVRKNVAGDCGEYVLAVARSNPDPWEGMFRFARCRYEETASELLPYWIFPLEDGAKIERHVPALPLSRDYQKLGDLRRSLAVYRMVFGQPRQEELIDYLQRHLSEDEIAAMVDRVKIDLAPPVDADQPQGEF